MKTVRKLLQAKGSTVWSIPPDASVFEAIRTMAEKHVGALVVMQEGKPVGILSERDYLTKVILKDRSSKSTQVREIMTSKLVCIRPESTIEECMAVMTERQIRHLPVLEKDTVVGMVSMRDVVREVISEKEFIINQLEKYITGAPA